MERVGEANDAAAPGHFAGQLQRRLNRVRTAWASELHAVIQSPRAQDDLVECGQEVPLGDGVHVQRVGDATTRNVVEQSLPQDRVIVAVVQGACASEEIQVWGVVLVI